jgi:hypothetical protein
MKRLFAALLAGLALAAQAVGPATEPFRANTAATVTVAATTTSGSTRVALVGNGPNVTLTSAGTANAFCEIGDSAVTAAVATGFPVLAGTVMTLGRVSGTTHIACITAASTATVYATTGEGS